MRTKHRKVRTFMMRIVCKWPTRPSVRSDEEGKGGAKAKSTECKPVQREDDDVRVVNRQEIYEMNVVIKTSDGGINHQHRNGPEYERIKTGTSSRQQQ